MNKLDKILKTENITGISIDSREIRAGYVFVAIKGDDHDGHDFIEDAVSKGARVVIVQKDVYINKNINKILVEDTKEAVAYLAKKYYKQPFDNIKTIGITGTNGKTTVTYLIESIFNKAGLKSGVIGTVNHRIGSRVIPSINTSPGPPLIYKLGAEMISNEISNCIMEVSSHSLAQGRLEGINFDIGIFTNLSRDHLDYHGNIADYFQEKLKLFESLDKDSYAVLNVDDSYFRKIKKATKAKIFSYGFSAKADVCCSDLGADKLVITYPQGIIEIQNKMLGKFNVYNILCAVAVCLLKGIDVSVIKDGIEECPQIPGRTEKVIWKEKDVDAYVDYAHTPDGLKNVLVALQEKNYKRVICVFGCGGERDVGKRSKMGFVAWRNADYCFVTSDNPRNENQDKIIDDILKGFLIKNKVEKEVDRKKAIKKALCFAEAGDVVLVAGKGHESYQIIGSINVPFNDKHVVEGVMRGRG